MVVNPGLERINNSVFGGARQVVEFNFLRANAQEPLSSFLEFITYEYMIENVMMLLKGTLSGRDVNELIEQCHPMVTSLPIGCVLERDD